MTSPSRLNYKCSTIRKWKDIYIIRILDNDKHLILNINTWNQIDYYLRYCCKIYPKWISCNLMLSTKDFMSNGKSMPSTRKNIAKRCDSNHLLCFVSFDWSLLDDALNSRVRKNCSISHFWIFLSLSFCCMT